MILNADLGESWYAKRVGDDAGLMPYLDTCNIACGFHGGDALTLRRTIVLALEHQVPIGAHPSFPDRKNFGRKWMTLDTDRLTALLLYQISALAGMVRAESGGPLRHVKPHGALYHYANEHAHVAQAIVRVMSRLNIPCLFGPPAGELREATLRAGYGFRAEGFVDRVYEPTLHLRSRHLPDACIDDPRAAAEQARLLAEEERVIASDGRSYPLSVDTLCIHGDHPGAVARLRAVRTALGRE